MKIELNLADGGTPSKEALINLANAIAVHLAFDSSSSEVRLLDSLRDVVGEFKLKVEK